MHRNMTEIYRERSVLIQETGSPFKAHVLLVKFEYILEYDVKLTMLGLRQNTGKHAGKRNTFSCIYHALLIVEQL